MEAVPLRFEVRLTPDKPQDGNLFGYPGSATLPAFYEDLLFGKYLLLNLSLPDLASPTNFLAAAFFMHRELLLYPQVSSLVYAAHAYQVHGYPALAHFPPDVATYLLTLGEFLPKPQVGNDTSPVQVQRTLEEAMAGLRAFLQSGSFPYILVNVTRKEEGTNGFFFGEMSRCANRYQQVLSVLNVYRQGYLKGFLYSPPDKDGWRQWLAFRKGPCVGFQEAWLAQVLSVESLPSPPEVNPLDASGLTSFRPELLLSLAVFALGSLCVDS